MIQLIERHLFCFASTFCSEVAEAIHRLSEKAQNLPGMAFTVLGVTCIFADEQARCTTAPLSETSCLYCEGVWPRGTVQVPLSKANLSGEINVLFDAGAGAEPENLVDRLHVFADETLQDVKLRLKLRGWFTSNQTLVSLLNLLQEHMSLAMYKHMGRNQCAVSCAHNPFKAIVLHASHKRVHCEPQCNH